MTLSIEGVRKSFRRGGGVAVAALQGIDLVVGEGELVVVVGPSASGKTTLLRCIAGLEAPDEGKIVLDGLDVTGSPPGHRDVAMVFQEPALLPHLTVLDNISFGMRARGEPGDEIRRLSTDTAERLRIGDVLDRLPSELSGGERQRVALARSIVRRPKAFLLDEPLSSLDPELRVSARGDIRKVQRDLGVSAVYVTHDHVEAMTLGDRVAVIREGAIEQVGAPGELYERPATTFVARFVAFPPMNLFPTDVYRTSADASTIGVRPEAVRLVPAGNGKLAGTIAEVDVLGPDAHVHVEVGPHTLVARTASGNTPLVGAQTGIDFDDADLHVFDAAGRALR